MKVINYVLKRIIDFVVSGLGIIFLFPIFVIIWIIIKLDSKGPALIMQERLGKNGKVFRMFKFRTMVYNINGFEYKYDKKGFLKVAQNDARLTRIGRRIRLLHLDETPQMFNVIAGHMSLVGPRPDLFIPGVSVSNIDKERLSVLPGMTGLAQINGEGIMSLTDRRSYDLKYINNYSLFLDIKILYQSIMLILKEVVSGK